MNDYEMASPTDRAHRRSGGGRIGAPTIASMAAGPSASPTSVWPPYRNATGLAGLSGPASPPAAELADVDGPADGEPLAGEGHAPTTRRVACVPIAKGAGTAVTKRPHASSGRS